MQSSYKWILNRSWPCCRVKHSQHHIRSHLHFLRIHLYLPRPIWQYIRPLTHRSSHHWQRRRCMRLQCTDATPRWKCGLYSDPRYLRWLWCFSMYKHEYRVILPYRRFRSSASVDLNPRSSPSRRWICSVLVLNHFVTRSAFLNRNINVCSCFKTFEKKINYKTKSKHISTSRYFRPFLSFHKQFYFWRMTVRTLWFCH